MSWTDWPLLIAFIIGLVVFLYGANTYNATLGYAGVYISVGSIAIYLFLYIYTEIKKKPLEKNSIISTDSQNP